MNSIEYKYCPMCGKELAYIGDGYKMYVCTNSTCRTSIKDDIIGDIDLSTYAYIQEKYNKEIKQEKSGYKAYMLLKENLSGPMFAKNTNEPFMKLRNTYCIIRATNKKDAINQFKDKYKVINISEEMVVEVSIREN